MAGRRRVAESPGVATGVGAHAAHPHGRGILSVCIRLWSQCMWSPSPSCTCMSASMITVLLTSLGPVYSCSSISSYYGLRTV